ncbi:hypothetical protein TNCT_474821 [Trichonephila clavata]|uniref:Uncharacterized protein n=1 Tax=Trichonephila clavata TaxID=2740835 RepID=A0A8X6JGK7_TRICU|nr:hypothetical protein TNCT_474821 [Trichonephila clavata]
MQTVLRVEMFTTAGDSSRKYHWQHRRGRDFISTFPYDKQGAVMNLERANGVDERCDCNKKRKWVCRRHIVVVVVAAVWMNGRRE